jgi:hypothetical protein
MEKSPYPGVPRDYVLGAVPLLGRVEGEALFGKVLKPIEFI